MDIQKRQETPIHLSALIGAIMGGVEAAVNHPLWIVKTRIQEGKPFTFQPNVLYRGLGVHCVSSMPLDILQVTASRVFFERVLSRDIESPYRRSCAGFLGGVVSAFVSCPAEMIMTQQEKTGENFLSASKSIYIAGKMKRFFTALIPTMLREGIFCWSVFAVVPLINKKCEKAGLSNWTAAAVSGVAAGLLATVLSQPSDVLKTNMQSSETSISMKQSLNHLYIKSGVEGVFSGMAWRSLRVSSAVLILGNLNNYLEKVFQIKQE